MAAKDRSNKLWTFAWSFKNDRGCSNVREGVRKHLECITCITAKTRHPTIPDSTRRTTQPLELICIFLERSKNFARMQVHCSGSRWFHGKIRCFIRQKQVWTIWLSEDLQIAQRTLTASSKFQDDEHSSRSLKRKLVRYGYSILKR